MPVASHKGYADRHRDAFYSDIVRFSVGYSFILGYRQIWVTIVDIDNDMVTQDNFNENVYSAWLMCVKFGQESTKSSS